MPSYVATQNFKADGERYAVGQSVPVEEIQNGYILTETGLAVRVPDEQIPSEQDPDGQAIDEQDLDENGSDPLDGESDVRSTEIGEPEPLPAGEPVEAETMSEIFGNDLAQDLQRGGYTSAWQVRSASDEELLAVDGVGKKSVRKIRAALGEDRFTGGA